MTARWALAAALLLASAPADDLRASSEASPRPTGGTIVVSPAGSPLPGIEVRVIPTAELLDPGVALASVSTGEDGRLRLDPPEREAVCVLVGKGWRSTIVPFPLPESITLTPGRDVPFQLIGPQGGVLGAARVPLSSEASLVVPSDEAGKGTLPGLPLEPVEVRASAGPLTGRARVAARDQSAVIHVARQASVVAGRVLDEDGRPLPRARAVLESGGSPGSGYAFRETSTDGDGAFRFERVKAGQHRLEVATAETLPHVSNLDLDGASALVVPPIRLRPGPRIDVQFVDSQTGEPIAQPRVVAESPEGRGFSMRQLARTEPDWVGDGRGRVRIDRLRAGPLTLALDTSPWARTRLPTVDVPPHAEVIDLGVIEVGRGARLEVTVDGEGADEAIPVMLDRGPGLSPLRPARTTTDTDGQASFDRLGPGRYRLRVGADGYVGRGVLWERWVSVSPHDQVLRERADLRFEDLSVLVRQVFSPLGGLGLTLVGADESDGPPEPPVRVAGSGSSEHRLLNAPMGRVARASTDDAGRGRLRRVVPGPHRLIVDLGPATWSVPLAVGTADSEAYVVVPPSTASLIVSDPAGRPIPTAGAEWRSSSGTRSSATAAPDGTVGLLGVGEEAGELRVSAPGFEPAKLVAAHPSELPPTVLLEPVGEPASFQVQVADEAGLPLPSAMITVVQRGDAEKYRYALTDRDGIARVGDLAPGRAEVRVQRVGYAPCLERLLDLAPGENPVESVVLTIGARIHVSREPESRPPAQPYRLRVSRAGGPRIEDYLDDASVLTVLPGESVSIGPLAPGLYALESRLGDSLLASRTIQVKTADVDVALR